MTSKADPEHIHNFWRVFYCEDADGVHKVYQDPHYPDPEHFAWNYECSCGAMHEQPDYRDLGESPW